MAQWFPLGKASSFFLELRFRIVYYFLGVFFAAIYAYNQKEILLYRLFRSLNTLPFSEAPLGNLGSPLTETLPKGTFDGVFGQKEIVFLEITEAFYTELTMVLVISLFISLPLFWIQTWFFLAPGLFSKEQLLLAVMGLCSWLLILGFSFFTEDFLLPKAWAFFLSFGDLSSLDTSAIAEGTFGGGMNLRYLPSIALYWKIFFQILLAMILSSQFPIILFLLIHWNWLTNDFLIKGRPWWIIFFLFWGALLSPPDLFSQFIIFFPLFFFF